METETELAKVVLEETLVTQATELTDSFLVGSVACQVPPATVAVAERVAMAAPAEMAAPAA